MNHNELANLHDELLHFLLKYRHKSEYFDKPTFLFRSTDDVEALQEGRWFDDNPETGWVDIYLTQSIEQRQHADQEQYVNNVRFGINLSGEWNISIDRQIKALDKFLQLLTLNFSSIPEQHLRGWQIVDSSGWIICLPHGNNYRTGLPKAVDTLFQFLNQNLQQKRKAPKYIFVSEEDFEQSLRCINEYRARRQVKRVSLNGFQIKNYQGIKATALSDLPQDARWIFLTGENSFGKTCLLKALAIGLYGDEEDIIIPRAKEPEIAVSYTEAYHDTSTITVRNHIRHPLFFRPLYALAAYGPSRLEIQAQDSQKQQARNSTATYNLFHSDGILKNIEAELLISYYDTPEKFQTLCQMLQALIPSLEKVELDKKRRKILYYEQVKTNNDQTKVFEPVEYEELASGMKSIIAMVGDIYLRLSEAQHTMRTSLLQQAGLDPQSDEYPVYAPDDLCGIVMIDELDLHLHPKWQRELPTLLSNVFPHVQFIASTHSPVPLLGAPTHSVFLKVERTLERGIEVTRLHTLEHHISNLLPNSILTSPIFDLEHIFPITHDNDEPIETADEYQTILGKKALEKELQQLARDFTFPEELEKHDEKGQ